MRKFRSFISTALLIVLLLSCNYVSAETIHVDQTLESKFLTLHLDADVENLEKGTPLTIYATDYPCWIRRIGQKCLMAMRQE